MGELREMRQQCSREAAATQAAIKETRELSTAYHQRWSAERDKAADLTPFVAELQEMRRQSSVEAAATQAAVKESRDLSAIHYELQCLREHMDASGKTVKEADALVETRSSLLQLVQAVDSLRAQVDTKQVIQAVQELRSEVARAPSQSGMQLSAQLMQAVDSLRAQ